MSDDRTPSDPTEKLKDVGDRIRSERKRAGLSQRELARRLGLSASMISQVESGMSQPSVATLWAIVTELNLSLDRLIRGEDFLGDRRPDERLSGYGPLDLVEPSSRRSIDLASGVRWEDLTARSDEGLDFVLATYDVGGASTPDGSLMRHHGREYGYVLSGTLGVQIEFHDYQLSPGDSIAFDSTRPHRLHNNGDAPVKAIWFVVDRDPSFGGSAH